MTLGFVYQISGLVNDFCSRKRDTLIKESDQSVEHVETENLTFYFCIIQ